MRLLILGVIIIPILGVTAAPFVVWGRGFHWTDLGLLVSLYVLTALGITDGYHRLFVHRSFETNLVVKFVLAVLSSMAVQGPLLKWVAMYPRHHQHADKAGTRVRPTSTTGASFPRCEASGTPMSAGCSLPTRRTSAATSRICGRAGPFGWTARYSRPGLPWAF